MGLLFASSTGPCQETSKYALTAMAAGDGWKCLCEGIASRVNGGEEVLARSDLENEEQVRGTVITCQWRGRSCGALILAYFRGALRSGMGM